MALDRFVDSILDYFRLPEHKKNAPPGVGARVQPAPPRPGTAPQPSARSAPAPASAPAPPTSSPPPAHTQAPQPIASPEPPPIEHSRTAAATPAIPDQQDDDPIRILLVEDDPKWAKLVNAYIAAINNEKTLGTLELVWVETLKATIEKISTRSYDLIFLDLMLPDSQGINTLDAVWTYAERVTTPVVVMSNLDSGGVMDRVREVTGRDILLKKNISKKVLFGQIDFNVFED